ncbi:MAG: hypothetical protein KDA75_14385, partial [Planctomycetaceae bacterium]|nr:hypothetical protein [Planctomycetaceae bacterium]
MLPRSAPYRPTRSPLPGRPERRLNPAVRLGLLLTLLAIAKTALAEDPTAEFLRGLLDRGLYRVAENEAIRRLDDPLLKPHEKVTWSIGLAQAYLRHAHAMNGSDRESLAAKAEQKLADLLRVSPPLPRQPQIRTQQALFTAERAEMLVWDFQQWGGDRQRTAAVDSLQAAATVLRDVRSQLDTDVRAAARRSDQDEADGELTAGEIRRLQRELDVQLARSLTSLVEIVPDGPERTSALREADQRLQTLADGWIGELRTWEARLLRARLARLRGENGQAAGIIRAALEDQPARWLAERFIAEQVRTLLADGKIDLALQTLLDETRS